MRRFEWILLLCLALSTGLLAMAPWWIMNPSRPQTQSEIELAFALRGGWNTVLSFTAFATAALVCLRRWLTGRALEKLAAVSSLFLIGLCASVANINLIGEIFQPIAEKQYSKPAEVGFLAQDDLLLVYGGRAYPLRLLGYHHLVDDEAGGERILATFDAFSRTAIVWKPELDGQPLQFTLVGIENQNFLMGDEQTGSWWRQATGEAIGGTLRGRNLDELPAEVVTLAMLAREQPDAEVLRPADGSVLLPSDPLAPREGLPPLETPGPLEPLELVVGVVAGGEAKAFPAEAVVEGTPLETTVGGQGLRIEREGPVLRAFAGEARLPVRVEYWYAWQRAHPETGVGP